jgi:hypothetical protein
LLLLLMANGCARSRARPHQAAPSGDHYEVTSASAAFFRYGPQQANGPDKKLPRKTGMTLVKTSFGYAQVRLDTGEQGYVARTDIRPAQHPVAPKRESTPTPGPLKYTEPNLPPVEPTAIPAPSSSP